MISPDEQLPEYFARIEHRVQYVLNATCRALAELAGLAEPVAVPELALRHWIQFRAQWLELLPDDPAAASQVERILSQKYPTEPEPRSRAAVEQAFDASRWISVRAGELAVRQGDPSDYLYILLEGQLAVFLPDSSRSAHIPNVIGKGEIIGEIEFVTRTPYQASLRSLRDSELIRIPRANIESLAEEDPRLWRRIATAAVCHLDRLISGKDTARPKGLAIALVRAGGSAIPDALGDRLAAIMNRLASTACVSSRVVDSVLGDGSSQLERHSIGEDRILEFLQRQEAANQYVIYQCDELLTPWTLRCLRQADRLLFVADAGSDCTPNEIELQTHGRETDLVLCEANPTRSPGTSAWVTERRPRLVHHVDLGNHADLARLSRFLTGRAMGLVLGGGGSRGFAHIGAVRAFREAGLEIDLVGGTSMGACIGAQCALKWDWQQMVESCREAFVRRKPLVDYAVPQVSLLTGRGISGVLRWMFEEHRIEDLPLTYFAISSDLITGQCVVHKSGLLRRALRASTAVAGIFPPVPDAGRLLVDGGVLNNLPVDVMSSLAPDVRIAAVDVNPYGFHTFANCTDYGDSLGSLKLIGSWLKPRTASKFPGIHTILERTTMLSGVKSAQDLLPLMTIYIHPPTDDIGFFETAKIDEIVDLGYRFASSEIEAWLEMNPS